MTKILSTSSDVEHYKKARTVTSVDHENGLYKWVAVGDVVVLNIQKTTRVEE